MKRKNLPKWTRFLSVSDIRHIKESGGLKIATVIDNERFQRGKKFPCFDCKRIARILRENGIIE